MLFCLHWGAGSPRLQAQRLQARPFCRCSSDTHVVAHAATETAALPAGGALAISAFAGGSTLAGPTCGAGAVGIHGELKQGWGPETTTQRMARMSKGHALRDCFSQEPDLETKLALRFLPWNVHTDRKSDNLG